MAAELDLEDLDTVAKLLETAMKTDVKKAKQREDVRTKAISQLEEFKRIYAAAFRSVNARERKVVENLEKGAGIAEHELPRDHPLVGHLNDAIEKAKAVPYNTDYANLDKAIDSLEDWDVSVEKDSLPKKAIVYLRAAKLAYESEGAEITKAKERYDKVLAALKKDLETLDDPDLKKKLREALDFHAK